MFSLDGFDEGELLDDPDGVAIATGGGVAFPQSDDEEVSTDGTYVCMYLPVHMHQWIQYASVPDKMYKFTIHNVLHCGCLCSLTIILSMAI